VNPALGEQDILERWNLHDSSSLTEQAMMGRCSLPTIIA
jgi:hypothetical protein